MNVKKYFKTTRALKKAHLFYNCFFGLFVFTGFLFFACKSKPETVSYPDPSASLVFEGIEAEDPEHITVMFSLEMENPFPVAGLASMESWYAEINGKRAASGFTLYNDTPFAISPGLSSFPQRLDMDVAALADLGLAPADDYEIKLIMELHVLSESIPATTPASGRNTSGRNAANNVAASSGLNNKLVITGVAVFPGVRPPTFTITSIAVLKAELVNTRFRVGLRIDNPNPYPVDLSAFSYELYGNGRLWADGSERNIIKIPSKASVTGNLFLMMNFINMRRDLLDQIIRLENVNYRFAGEARVGTGVDYLPSFNTGFDLSGYSEVFDN